MQGEVYHEIPYGPVYIHPYEKKRQKRKDVNEVFAHSDLHDHRLQYPVSFFDDTGRPTIQLGYWFLLGPYGYVDPRFR